MDMQMRLLLHNFLLFYSAGQDVRSLPVITFSSKTWCRSPETVAKHEFELLLRNPSLKNVVSISQNCSETQISFAVAQPFRQKHAVDRPKL